MPETVLLQKMIDDAITVLNRGGVIAYPTETVYGLGGDATLPETIQRIYEIKGREFRNPLLVLVRDEEVLVRFVKAIPETAQTLMDHFWPGPLTMIFEANEAIPSQLTGGTGKVGVRVSSDPVCTKLLSIFSHPLISTSANRSGVAPSQSAEAVRNQLGNYVDLIIDDGPRVSSTASTVIDITESSVQMIREGVIPHEEISKVLEG